MNRAGRFIRERREKLGLSQAALAGLVGVSASTMSRIENGIQTPSDKEAEFIAAALSQDAAFLKRLCDEDRRAKSHLKTLHGSGGFFVEQHLANQLELVEKFIAQSEGLRPYQPYYAINYVDNVIDRLRTDLRTVRPAAWPALNRLLAKALITRAFSYTLVVSLKGTRSRLDKFVHLDEITELSQFLSEEDSLDLNRARMLPAMVFYLMRKYQLQMQWLETHLPGVNDPYICSLGLRDQIVVAGLTRDWRAYNQAVLQAQNVSDKVLFDSIDHARILEGTVQALIHFSSPGAEQKLAEAEKALTEAELKGRGHPFVRSQIVRTKVRFLINYKRSDQNTILETARTSIPLFRAGSYHRHLDQLKRMLKEANLTLSDDFWTTV